MSQYLCVVQNYSPVWNWFVCVSIFHSKVCVSFWNVLFEELTDTDCYWHQIFLFFYFFKKKHYSFCFISPNVWTAAVNLIRMRVPADKRWNRYRKRRTDRSIWPDLWYDGRQILEEKTNRSSYCHFFCILREFGGLSFVSAGHPAVLPLWCDPHLWGLEAERCLQLREV